MPSVSAKDGSFYKPELDALRFGAFLCVFCSHLQIAWSGWDIFGMTGAYGVPIFFLLSSYLIVSLLLREKARTGKVDFVSFAARRVLRIWPLYYTVLFSLFVLSRVFGFAAMDATGLLAFSCLLGNLYIYKFGWIVGVAAPLWSVSVEEQFYLVAPWFIQRQTRKVVIYASCTILLIAYMCLAWQGHHGAMPRIRVWTNTLVQFQFFAAGALLGVFFEGTRMPAARFARFLLFASGAGCWYVASEHFHPYTWTLDTSTQLVGGYFFILAGSVCFFLSILDMKMAVPQFLIYLGKISFGLYVFHYPILTFGVALANRLNGKPMSAFEAIVVQVLCLPITCCIAALSYRYLERPFLLLKKRFETVRTRDA